jgi:hypothetical protein
MQCFILSRLRCALLEPCLLTLRSKARTEEQNFNTLEIFSSPFQEQFDELVKVLWICCRTGAIYRKKSYFRFIEAIP